MPSAWESKVFKGLTSTMIRTFTADDLRRECASQSLITQSQKTKFAVLIGPAMQNEALLDAVRSGDDKSFHLFLECIREVEPEANVSAILEKLDQIDKYQTAAAAAPQAAEPDASPISKPPAAPRKPCPDPFESDTYITTLHPWIKKLDATGLAGKVQGLGMLTGDQVTELDRIKKNDGGPAHNARLLEIIHGEEIHGFVKLYKAVLTVTKNIDKLDQMKSLIPDEYLSEK
ncbi:uncharacterized protein LOC135819795 isoform X2 [Sycon ciliatum]|uniref:uncharacterized protein LOC135819795 isoform X2 n=1 Tax=Sycon ciliatum TaxID=27933 RepID=UPI0031F6C4EF